jgi:hypothetical protein
MRVIIRLQRVAFQSHIIRQRHHHLSACSAVHSPCVGRMLEGVVPGPYGQPTRLPDMVMGDVAVCPRGSSLTGIKPHCVQSPHAFASAGGAGTVCWG